jgi:hypothetical protein
MCRGEKVVRMQKNTHDVRWFIIYSGIQSAGVYIRNSVSLKWQRNNTEIAMKLTTTIDSENEVYVDLNGFQVLFYSAF